jgi:hypothetical protein
VPLGRLASQATIDDFKTPLRLLPIWMSGMNSPPCIIRYKVGMDTPKKSAVSLTDKIRSSTDWVTIIAVTSPRLVNSLKLTLKTLTRNFQNPSSLDTQREFLTVCDCSAPTGDTGPAMAGLLPYSNECKGWHYTDFSAPRRTAAKGPTFDMDALRRDFGEGLVGRAAAVDRLGERSRVFVSLSNKGARPGLDVPGDGP